METYAVTTYLNGSRPGWEPETLQIVKSVPVNPHNTYGPYVDGRYCHDAVHLTDCGRAFFQRAWRVGNEPSLNALYELHEDEVRAYGVAELAAQIRSGAL